jgi:hypothetical protein
MDYFREVIGGTIGPTVAVARTLARHYGPILLSSYERVAPERVREVSYGKRYHHATIGPARPGPTLRMSPAEAFRRESELHGSLLGAATYYTARKTGASREQAISLGEMAHTGAVLMQQRAKIASPPVQRQPARIQTVGGRP